MRVLITRPEHDAPEFEALLRQRGHQPFTEPLLSITFDEGPDLDVGQYGLIVFTSANGVRAAARRITNRRTPALAVGPATATEARNSGWTNVLTSRGEGTTGLVEYLVSHPQWHSHPILHISGTDVAGDLLAQAGVIGYSITRLQLYSAKPATGISTSLHRHLEQGTLDAATFFSPRTAKIFCDLVHAAGLAGCVAAVTACAISNNTANSLKILTFRKVLVAQNATAQAMLDLVDSL